MIELMREFDSTVEGIAVLVSTNEPEEKLVNEYFSLIALEKVDEQQQIIELKPFKN